jgi:hypothetical protein
MSENLYVVIATKLGFVSEDAEGSIDITMDQDSVIQKHLNGYRSLLVSLSGNKVSLDAKQVNGLRRALDVCEMSGDSVAQKLCEKLDKIEKEGQMLLVDLL